MGSPLCPHGRKVDSHSLSFFRSIDLAIFVGSIWSSVLCCDQCRSFVREIRFVKYHPQCDSLFHWCQNGASSCLAFFVVHSWDILIKTPYCYLLAGQRRRCNPLSSRLPLSRIRFLFPGIHIMLKLPAAKSTTNKHLRCTILSIKRLPDAHCTILRGPRTVRGARTLHICVCFVCGAST